MNDYNDIKLLISDIDGVWTDAKMHYTENGDFMKSFSTYDGMGVEMLRNKNIETVNQIKNLIQTNYYHIFTSNDVTGVGICAAIKNIF